MVISDKDTVRHLDKSKLHLPLHQYNSLLDGYNLLLHTCKIHLQGGKSELHV